MCNARDENYHKIRVLMIKLLQKKKLFIKLKNKGNNNDKNTREVGLKVKH